MNSNPDSNPNSNLNSQLNLKQLLPPLPNRSAPDLIAEALRLAIGQGRLGEGQSLRQDEIAGQFGVSRIPVREALRQLEAEGLVIFHPNRGAMVSGLSVAEVQEIGEIRVALETMALELAIPQLRDADLCRAAGLLKDMAQPASQLASQPASQPDLLQLCDLDWQFRRTLYAPANRARLLSLIKMLHVNLDRYMRQICTAPDCNASLAEHHQLLDACWQRDTAAASQILRLHLERRVAALVAHLSASGQALRARSL